ncbi:class I SAM-dependent methyltransferase [Salinispira pacifica]
MSELFYSVLARRYDELFPFDRDVSLFLERRFEGLHTILDVGCGTGTYACHLASREHEVSGLDSDVDMIARAATREGCRARFVSADMRRVRGVAPGPWNGVYCIGNTLVHLAGEVEIGRFLSDVSSILEPGGVAVVQIINFDRILDGGIRTLPELSAGSVTMRRAYSEPDSQGRIWFRAELRESADDETVSSVETELTSLRSGALRELCTAAGLVDVRLFGSFAGTAYAAAESFLTIATAVKPS